MARHPAAEATAAEVAAPQLARAAGLRYVSDHHPGIRREPVKDGFRYRGVDGKLLRDKDTLERIKSLAIPPAWTDVWICPQNNGHIQATGRDARKRKQYRYHPRWRSVRDEVKYDRMISFGKALPAIRKKVDSDLALPGLPREKVLAAIALQEFEKFDSQAQARKNIVGAIEAVARKLGNTPAICRKCYVHPEVLEAYLDGVMLEALRQGARKKLTRDIHALSPEEVAVLAFLQKRLEGKGPMRKRTVR